jgi:hypothetical protein
MMDQGYPCCASGAKSQGMLGACCPILGLLQRGTTKLEGQALACITCIAAVSVDEHSRMHPTQRALFAAAAA